MILPDSFINRMKEYLENSEVGFDGFLESFDDKPLKGIRINQNKVSAENYANIMEDLGETASKVSWCSCGYFTDNESSGNDPYYHAGVYYPQEPSAMLPAEVMAAKPGDYVLDLCAAPGGKACRLGEDLKGEGLLIANEISENRAKALLRNIERMGIKNCVILNETPEHLAVNFNAFFDKILVDAPCSGEGMFRRDPNAVKSWEKYGPVQCIELQKGILEMADKMLKPGGELVYSTCTFCEGEDELQIIDFMNNHDGYSVIAHPEIEGVTHAGNNSKLPGSMRIWPHKSEGDGHFCVHLKKSEDVEMEGFSLSTLPSYKRKRDDNYGFSKSKDAMMTFLKDILVDDCLAIYKKKLNNEFVIHTDKIHLLPVEERIFNRLKVVKLGSFPGEIKTTSVERLFMPSHSLALELNGNDIKDNSKIILSRDDERLYRYLKGETITLNPEEVAGLKKKGYVVITVNNYPIGFGKIAGPGQIKNLYPKAWRIV